LLDFELLKRVRGHTHDGVSFARKTAQGRLKDAISAYLSADNRRQIRDAISSHSVIGIPARWLRVHEFLDFCYSKRPR
jgi:ectoine hydroxylase-related dioxygenase (phytanoyl-CoA dioxygenase family)